MVDCNAEPPPEPESEAEAEDAVDPSYTATMTIPSVAGRRRQLLAADLPSGAYGLVRLEILDDSIATYNVTLHNVELLINPGNITYSHLHKQDDNLTHVGYLAGSQDEAMNFALPAFGDVLLANGDIDLNELSNEGSSLGYNITSLTWLEILDDVLLADIHSENYMPPAELLVGTFVLVGGNMTEF